MNNYMSESKNWKFSILVTAILVASGFAMLSFSTTGFGDQQSSEDPIAGNRLEGHLNLYAGDKADQMFEHTSQSAYMGSAVTVGDLDGDDADDYIIGAMYASNYAGEVYIYFGMKNVHPVNDPSNANITITGSAQYGYFGNSLTTGDFNGDGIDDLLVGAEYAANYYGEAYIFFGKKDWPKKASLKTSNADVILKGENSNYYSQGGFGAFVGKGDLDGDGYYEPIVSAPYMTEEDIYSGNNYGIWGKVYFWWGRPSWNSVYDCEKGEYDVGIYGKQLTTSNYFDCWGSLGSGNSMGGDLNMDGVDDLLLAGGYEVYFPSSSGSSYTYDAGGLHILESKPNDRTIWKKDFSIEDLTDGPTDLPKHHWMYASSSSHMFGWYLYAQDMDKDGMNDLVATRSYPGSGSAFIFYNSGNMDDFGGTGWSDRLKYSDHKDYTTISGMDVAYVDDFDNDGYGDIYGGSYNKGSASYGGQLFLIYGASDWGTSKGISDADYLISGNTYDYLGYYYYFNLASGDFNADTFPDLFFGAFYHTNSQTNARYAGGAYVVLTVPPKMAVKSFGLLDGDGEENNVMTMEAGGNGYEPTNDQIGDGVYTFKVAFNDTWTVVEAQEIRVQFKLKSEYLGLMYEFGYSPVNETFFIEEGLGGGIRIYPERCDFKMLGYHDAEVYFAISITREFLTQATFDVVGWVSTARNREVLEYKDYLRVEMDLNFNDQDIKVLRGDQEVKRGDFLAGGLPLVLTGVRVVYDGTEVSPMDDKFFLRIIDSYGRIFENQSTGGFDVYFMIPTNVDSGKYTFSMNIVIRPEFVEIMEDLSIIPDFYVTFDFLGPDAPPNLATHADTPTDPEGRWDDDPQMWVSWDPAFDSQVGIDHYEYSLEGPEGFFVQNSTDGLWTEIQLGSDGVYDLMVWAVDRVGNHGSKAHKTIIKDTGEILFSSPVPNYLGERWYNSPEINVIVQISDAIVHEDGPMVKLSTLEYAVTRSMTEKARDEAAWKKPKYTVLSEQKEDTYYQYTLSIAITNLVEGKNNFVWFRVMDEAGNMGMTSLVATSDPDYEEKASTYNPSNVWVDVSALTYTDADPSAEPLESNIIKASVVINDLLSGVDASTVQYSISRNGLTNYGGWISANLNNDGNTLVASTVSSLLFQPGSTNYIRWRAMDTAGNGYTISEDLPIIIIPPLVNNPPVAEISSPVMQAVYNTRDTITFDASGSEDVDLDTLTFRWVLANKEPLSDLATFNIPAVDLERGVHVITLYVSDGEYTATDSISIYVKLHPDEVDTDNDGINDGADDDDDNDGLLDVDEIRMGTNPRLADTDQDGTNDKIDPEPLNPRVVIPKENEGKYSYWDILILFVILSVFIILIAAMVVFQRRSAMEKNRVLRHITQEGRIVQRYEVLTGIEAPLLPQVKEMGVSLPPIAAQQVAPVKRARSLTETPTLPPTAKEPVPKRTPAPSPAPSPAPEPKTPAPAPEPVPAPKRRERSGSGKTPGAIPTPEELTATAALPGQQTQTSAPQTTTCDLCGSSIDVPGGAVSVECPLCGEIKRL